MKTTKSTVYKKRFNPIVFLLILGVCLIIGVLILSQPKAATNWQIMNAGDSIMQGGQDGNIRTYLYDKLKAGGVTFNFIGKQKSFFNGSAEETQVHPPPPDNGYAARGGLCLLANARAGCGFNGVEPVSNDNGILGMIQESWQAGYDPNVYVIMGGINDNTSCNCDVSPRYKEFLDALFAHTPDGYVFFSIGYRSGDQGYYDDHKNKLEAIASQFRAAGKEAYFVDAAKNLSSANYPSDNVHPDAAGHEKMAEEYYKVMIDVLGGSTSTPTPTPSVTVTPTPTPTPTVTPTPNPTNAKYDLDDNGEIGIGDLTLLIKDYPKHNRAPTPNSPADFNNSGAVDLSDLSKLVSLWGQQV